MEGATTQVVVKVTVVDLGMGRRRWATVGNRDPEVVGDGGGREDEPAALPCALPGVSSRGTLDTVLDADSQA